MRPKTTFKAFESLMKETPNSHYDSGYDGIYSECRSCRFHNLSWFLPICFSVLENIFTNLSLTYHPMSGKIKVHKMHGGEQDEQGIYRKAEYCGAGIVL